MPYSLVRLLRSGLIWVWDTIAGVFIFQISAKQAALFRIIFGSVVLWLLLLPVHDIRGFFTDAGMFPTAMMKPWSGTYGWSLFYYLTDPSIIVSLYYVLLAATVAFIFGIYPRIMAVIMFVLLLSFQQRNIFITNGADRVVRIALLYTLFLEVDQAYIPKFIQRKSEQLRERVAGWPMRLIAIQIGFIYLFSALFKLQYGEWINGGYIFHMLGNPNYSYIDPTFLKNYPVVVNFATYFTLFTELSTIYLVWSKRTRPFILLCLVALHVGIASLSNVVLFSQVMIATYIVFLNDEELTILTRFCRRIGKGILSASQTIRRRLRPQVVR